MGDDYVDYTLLQKKGILKLKEEKLKSSLRNEDGFVDLTPLRNEVTSEQSSPTNSTPNMGNFGFLSDMASIGSSNPSSNSSSENNLKIDEGDLSALKIKIDNMEYQLDRFIERIDKLEEKLTKEEN